jgi:hypothetical protein
MQRDAEVLDDVLELEIDRVAGTVIHVVLGDCSSLQNVRSFAKVNNN